MKTLEFVRDEKKDRVTVACADGMVSVYSTCAYCRHCAGIVTGKRVAPAPQKEALNAMRLGKGSDDSLMTAAMMFNTLVRDGHAIACDDDTNTGYLKLY
jgi:cytochrome c5